MNKEPRLRFTDEERADPALEKPIRKAENAAARADKAQANIPKKKVRQTVIDPDTGKKTSKLTFEDKKKPPSKLSQGVKEAPVHLVAGKFHKEIRETEQDNVGVESAHKSEEAVETSAYLVREGYRSHKLKPYRKAAQAERQLEKANVNVLYQKSLQENPQFAIQQVINNMLGRIIVVEDLGEASVVAKNLGYRNRIVTMDGQVINAGGSFTGGSTARSVGVFSRKQELDELRAKVLKLDERRAAAEKEAAARKAEVDNLTAQLAGAESEGMTAAAARLKAEMELDQLNTALEEGKNAAAHRGQEIAALEQQLRENTAAAAQAENARKQAEAEIETHRKELESLGASTSDVTRQREEASQKLSDNRMQKLRTEKDLSLHEAALETLKGRSGEAEARVRELQANVAAAKERIAANELRANEIKRASEENKQKITAAEESIRKANAERMEKEAAVTRLTQENRTLTDERERMSGEMARLAERKTAAETELNTTASKLWEEYQLTEAEAEKLCVPFANVADLRRQVAEVRGKIRALGNVNVGAIEEYKEVKERYDFMKAQVTDVEKSRAELNRMIAELCSEMQEMFTASFKEINRNFGAIFRELFGGGSARLYLSDENDVLNSGIEIQVSPPGKVIKNLSALSGGEQALVAISIYFAILAVNPSPFCILDEIEAALDDVNVTRYAQYLRRMTERTQFIVITHRRGTMEAADVLYGVTMQEDGVSKILRLDLENVSADLIS